MGRSSFDVLAELIARDLDTALIERSRKKTFSERLEWLEDMQKLGQTAKRGQSR